MIVSGLLAGGPMGDNAILVVKVCMNAHIQIDEQFLRSSTRNRYIPHARSVALVSTPAADPQRFLAHASSFHVWYPWYRYWKLRYLPRFCGASGLYLLFNEI